MTIPIIDAHHHIWRFDKTPWLQGPMQPRIFGDYADIRRDYSISEFAADVKPHGVVGSVYVQINVAPGDEVWEVEWARAEGARENLVQAIVSFADLAADNLGEVLDQQLEKGPVRGVRQQLHWHPVDLYRFAPTPDMMLLPKWQRGLTEIERRGLHFELQVFQNQYENALKLIDIFPNIPFVLLHAGMPEDLSDTGIQTWSQGLAEFSRRPNVKTKLSAFGTFTHRCDAQEWAPIIRQAVDTFGPDRCIFGSNFPIEKLWTDYGTLIDTVKRSLSVYSPEEKHKILFENAKRLYNIEFT